MNPENPIRTRVLSWEACFNVRDLGGYLIASGGQTRWRAVVRSDSLARLTEAGRAELRAYGVRSVIDLRTPAERQAGPNPFAQPGGHGITYTSISLVDPGAPDPGFTTLARNYIWILDRFGPSFAAVMTAIAEAPPGTVLVHCVGGKDRTGLTAALLLELAGVPREIVAEDYALTAECLRPLDEQWLAEAPDPEERRRRERLLDPFIARAEVMLEALEHLDHAHGGAEGYLVKSGLPAHLVESLRQRLILGDA